MKTSLLTTGFTVLSFMLPMAASAASFSRMYVFGDSLSDPGNIFNASTAAQAIPPILLPPGTVIPPVEPEVPPYDEGGRFSNGLVWADYLAADLGIDLKPSTTLSVLFPTVPIPSPITFINNQPAVSPFFNGATATNSVNFAFGAAQTGFFGAGDEFSQLVPGVLTQVGWFANDLAQAQQQADSDALYVVWAGANDYQIVVDADPVQSVANLAQAVQSLYSLGARNFLVPNLPDLGQTPRALSPNSPVLSDILTQRTIQHNALLGNTLGVLEQSLADINLISFDVFSLFNEVRGNPREFGFTNVTEACLAPDPRTVHVDDPGTIIPCPDPSQFLFWDGIHPTTTAHQILAERFKETLESEPESVPEPNSSAALALLGLTWLVHKKFNKSPKKSPDKLHQLQ